MDLDDVVQVFCDGVAGATIKKQESACLSSKRTLRLRCFQDKVCR